VHDKVSIENVKERNYGYELNFLRMV